MTTTAAPSVSAAMIRQIGRGVILATSGGRYAYDADTLTLSLPVRYGYSVEVTYERGLDLYTVRRIFARGTRRWVKAERTHVYADSLPTVVYHAGCYLDPMPA